MKYPSIRAAVLAALLVALGFAATSASASGDERIVGHIEPLPHELLPEPIQLEHLCGGVSIVEWRPTRDIVSTSPSKEGVAHIRHVCVLALSNVQRFARTRGLKFRMPKQVEVKLSLMPADINFDGTSYRNLNDRDYRFKFRTAQNVRYIWGFATDVGRIYMRNDPVYANRERNPYFATVLAHELWHAVSFQAGLYETLAETEPEREQLDEELAVAFTRFLGMVKP